MGVAQSSNAASVISNISNYVNESTSANTSQIQNINQVIDIDQCALNIQGNIDITGSAEVNVSNAQIAQAVQNTNLKNNIAQQLQQEALSKVGSLGLGFADASNNASELSNASNDISQAMSVAAQQYSTTNQKFTCERSTINAANLDINFSTKYDVLSSQTLNQSQVSNIVNTVDQSISQKATATVEGLTGLLLMIALIIGVLGYSVSKPLTTGGGKIIVVVAVTFILFIIVGGMYLKNTPPLFKSPDQCIKGSQIGCQDECIDFSNNNIYLAYAPSRYRQPVSQPTADIDMLRMAIAGAQGSISSASGLGNNGGYNAETMLAIQKTIDYIHGKVILNSEFKNYTKPPNMLTTCPASLSSSCTIDKVNKTDTFYTIPSAWMKAPATSSSDFITASCTPGSVSMSASPDTSLCNGTGNSSTNSTTSYLCPTSINPSSSNTNCIISELTTTDPTMGLAMADSDSWNDYLTGNPTGSYPFIQGQGETSQTRVLYARFLLSQFIGSQDLNIVLFPDIEICLYKGPNNSSVIGSFNSDTCYQYISDQAPDPVQYTLPPAVGGGYITGQIGYCNNRQYKFDMFMKKIGIWILVGLFVIACMYMIYTWYKPPSPKDAVVQGSGKKTESTSKSSSSGKEKGKTK
jgi:hypothetical protein